MRRHTRSQSRANRAKYSQASSKPTASGRRDRAKERAAREELVYMLRADTLSDSSLSAAKGHIGCLTSEQLIAPGNDGHESLVHFAVFHYHPEVALHMVEKMAAENQLVSAKMLGPGSPAERALSGHSRTKFIVSIIEKLTEEELVQYAVEEPVYPWLFSAAALNDLEVVKCLLQHLPASTYVTTDDVGWTPLHIVAGKGAEGLEMAQLLLTEAPEMSFVKDQAGKLPRDLATHDEMRSVFYDKAKAAEA